MEVFQYVLGLIPNGCFTFNVCVVADFEAAVWQILSTVLPGTEVKGYLFHFTQPILWMMTMMN